MRSRLAVLSVLLAGVLAIGIWQWRRPAQPDPDIRTAGATVLVPEPDRRLDLGATRTRDALAARLAAAYRLPADRRMVAAITDVRALLSPGNGVDLVHAEWSADHWSLRCGTDEAGMLPEYPLFADALAMLDGWAKRQVAHSPLPAGAPEGIATGFLNDYLPEEALAHLDGIAGRSGPTRALVAQALTACTQLAVLLAEDRTELSDTTATRALALLALARVCDGTPHAREQCALAWAMGYREEARALASALPAEDPLGLLVRGRAEELRSLASASDATREAQLYHLILLAQRGLVASWLEAAPRTTGPGPHDAHAALCTALAFQRFDMGRVIGAWLLTAALTNVQQAPDRPAADASTLLAFERAMAHPENGAHGRLSGGAVSASRRALFYSGLAAQHEFLAENLSSARAVRDMGRRLAPARTSPGGWFVRWQAHIAGAMNGRADVAGLRADLGDPRVPAPLAFGSFGRLAALMAPGSVPARALARELALRLDTRPRSAYRDAFVAQETVRWPELTEQLLLHASRGLGLDEPGSVILLALMREDVSRLAAIVDDPRVDARAAVAALRVWVEADSARADALVPRFARLCVRSPATWALVDSYADLLEARGRFAEAERAVRTWLGAADSTQDALDETLATTMLARLQRKQGRVAEALRTIGDLDRCQQLGAMEEKARLLQLSGRSGAALAVADSAVSRYPELATARTSRLLLLWRAGRTAEVARLLAQPDADSLYSATEWSTGFVEIFRGRHGDARLAMAALRAAAPAATHHLWWIAEAFARGGDAAFAAELMTHSDPGSGGKRAFGLATAFDVIIRAQGEDAAWQWLQQQHMGPDARVLLGGLLLMADHPASAYELTALGEDADVDEYAWLLRAAAWKLDGGRRDDWRDAVRAHARKASPGEYAQLTRFMLGELSESDVLPLADGYRRENEVWFFCGLRAWGEGRARDAVRWSVLCQEAGATSDGEYIWSYGQLEAWARAWRASERLPLPSKPPV